MKGSGSSCEPRDLLSCEELGASVKRESCYLVWKHGLLSPPGVQGHCAVQLAQRSTGRMLGMALQCAAPCHGALLSQASHRSLAQPFPAKSELKPPPRCGAREPPCPVPAMGVCLMCGLQGLKRLWEKRLQSSPLPVGGRQSWALWVAARV